MKKKLILLVLVVVIAAGAGLVLPNKISKIGKENTITSSQLEKAIDISQLSTAEFVYNGVAGKKMKIVRRMWIVILLMMQM